MANRKREVPLTPAEKLERNRVYQQRRREKTNNGYARAYRRASQRATKWFQENREGTWHRWLNEELAVDEDTPYTALRDPKTGNIVCMHDGGRHIIGFTVQCDMCAHAIGSVAIDDDELRTELNENYAVD